MPYASAVIGGTEVTIIGGGGDGFAYTLPPRVLSQNDIDNGITLEAGTTDLAASVLTIDEAGGLRQTPTTDYLITGTLLTFTTVMKAKLFLGYTIRLSWS